MPSRAIDPFAARRYAGGFSLVELMVAMAISLKVNGATLSVPAESDTPLLYVLRNDLELNGAKFGCGMAQCGACTVLIGGQATRSCLTPLSAVGEREVVTLEGLGTEEHPSPLQQAFIDEQAAQCGYCLNGVIIRTVALLAKSKNPSVAEIKKALSDNLCRCGTYIGVRAAVLQAANQQKGGRRNG